MSTANKTSKINWQVRQVRHVLIKPGTFGYWCHPMLICSSTLEIEESTDDDKIITHWLNCTFE